MRRILSRFSTSVLMGLAFTLPALLIAGGLVLYHLRAAERFITEEGVRYGTILTDQILTAAQRFLRLGSIAAVQEMIEETGSRRSVVHVALVDGDGRILASNRRDWIGRDDGVIVDPDYPDVSRAARATFQPQHRLVDRGKRLLLVSPLLIQGTDPILSRARGTLFLKVDQERQLRVIYATILRRGVVSAVAILLVSLLLLVWVRAFLARPILAVATFLRHFAAGEAIDPPSPSGPREVARLGADVAAMARELREKQSALAASEERHRSLMQGAYDAILTVEPASGRILEANAMFHRLFGYAPEETRSLTVAQLHPAEDRARLMAAYAEAARLEHKDFHDIPCVRKDGGRFNVDIRGGPIRLQNRTVMTWIVRDRTERQRLEQQLRAAQRMESVATLAGGMAHDFNNLLTAILGYTRLILGRSKPEDPHHRHLVTIERSAQRAADLTSQLQAFSRRAATRTAPASLNDVLASALDALRQELPHGVTLASEGAADLWTIAVDAEQIRATVRQLCSNAVDAMPQGGRLTIRTANRALTEVDCRGHLQARPGRFVTLTVEDTGRGIEPDIHNRIFEPFFTTKETGRGTGLGLAMVYGMVKGHDGWVEVDSAPGRGSRFTLFLPQHDPAAAGRLAVESPAAVLARMSGVAPPPAAAAPAPQALPGAPIRQRTVLAVDDESTILALARDILELHGYAVVTARNGEEALHRYLERPGGIDVVLLDLTMPMMGGRECLEKLIALDPAARVVISSGFSEDGTVRDLLAAGALDYIQKPYEIDVLARVIRKAIEADRRPGPVASAA